MSFNLVIKKGENELKLDSFRSYYELDKTIANFISSNELLMNLDENFEKAYIKSDSKIVRASSKMARRLIPIFDNKKENDLLDSIVSSTFSYPASEFNIDTFKNYLMNEKLVASKINTSYGKDRIALINNMLKLLDYGNYNKDLIIVFRSNLDSLLEDKSYSKIRNIYSSLNDLEFLYDESLNKVFNQNEYKKDETKKQELLNNYNKKIIEYNNINNQITFDDLLNEKGKTKNLNLRG